MNSVNKSILLLTTTLIAAFIPIQSHADVFGGSGQYVMMPHTTDGYVWILDTDTGKVRVCEGLYLHFNPPTCTSWSEA